MLTYDITFNWREAASCSYRSAEVKNNSMIKACSLTEDITHVKPLKVSLSFLLLLTHTLSVDVHCCHFRALICNHIDYIDQQPPAISLLIYKLCSYYKLLQLFSCPPIHTSGDCLINNWNVNIPQSWSIAFSLCSLSEEELTAAGAWLFNWPHVCFNLR